MPPKLTEGKTVMRLTTEAHKLIPDFDTLHAKVRLAVKPDGGS